MSSYLNVEIEIYDDKADVWRQAQLYKKDFESGEFKPVPVWIGSASFGGDLFVGNPFNGYDSAIKSPTELPQDVSEEVANIFKLYEADGWSLPNLTCYDYVELDVYRSGLKVAKSLLKKLREADSKLQAADAYKDDDIYDDLNGQSWLSLYADETEESMESFDSIMSAIDRVIEEYGKYYPKQGEVRVIIWID